MIRGEGWIPGIEELDLRVIQMSDWNRDMMWPETGLEWIPTSPNLPTFESALIYAGTCFIEATTASEGRGTPLPFLTIGAPWFRYRGFSKRPRPMGAGKESVSKQAP